MMKNFNSNALRSFGVVALLLLSGCNGIPLEEPPVTADAKKVVLLHGLMRGSFSMAKIERALKKKGYDTCNIDYPSSQALARELVGHIVTDIKECYGELPEHVNYVSHSLGGIMIRALDVAQQGPKIKRAVMLAPPNHGSELVDIHRNSWMFRKLLGPVAQYLGTDPGSLPKRLGPATFDVGIIAGTGRSNPLGAWVFDEPSDGTVSVASTRLAGMSDFITVPFGHTLIMRKKTVINEISTYLDSGSFSDRFREQ